MTKIDLDTVDKLARLSRLEFSGAEKEEIRNDLSRMLDFVEKLQELNTEGVEPLIYMNETGQVLRADEEKQTITQQQALQNAPKKDSDYFKVPKVVEKK